MISMDEAENIGRRGIHSVLSNFDLSKLKREIEWGLWVEGDCVVLDLFTTNQDDTNDIVMIAQAYVDKYSAILRKVVVYGIVVD